MFALKNALDEDMFPNFSLFIGLALPQSSATAQRFFFSQLNLIKSKQRNKLLNRERYIMTSKELLDGSNSHDFTLRKYHIYKTNITL